jgi:hypothetical protein
VLPDGNLIIGAILGIPCRPAREMSLILVSGEALLVASVALLISKSLDWLVILYTADNLFTVCCYFLSLLSSQMWKP